MDNICGRLGSRAGGAKGGGRHMPDPALDPITKRYADHSTPEGFAFSFFCDKCEKEQPSAWYAFNPGGFAPPIDPRVYQMLWTEQHKAAYERANREAFFTFNRCPKCGRRVCMECFYLAETDMSDICKDCLAEQKDTGGHARCVFRMVLGSTASSARVGPGQEIE